MEMAAMTDDDIFENYSTVRLLRIRVMAGVNLAKKDIFGASDPYVRILLKGKTRNHSYESVLNQFQTRTIKKTLNPVWDQEFTCKVKPNDHKLVFEVFDENRLTRDDFLGVVEIQLAHAMISWERSNRPVTSRDFILRPRSSKSRVRGHLRLYLAYFNDEGGDVVLERRPSQVAAETSRPAEETQPAEPDWEIVEDNSSDTLSAPTTAPGPPAAGNEDGSVDPLPPDWEEKIDVQGRTFFVNHKTRTTQWERPSITGRNVLPAGWEEKVDANGRTYYVDHNTRTTTWVTPGQHGSNDIGSPHGRDSRQHRDAAVVFRSRHQISQEDALGSSFEVLSITPPDQEELPNTPVSQIPTAVIAVSDPSPSSSSSDSLHYLATNDAIDEEPLPPGWAQSVAPNGRIFYIDHNSKVTTWDDPRKKRDSGEGSIQLKQPPYSSLDDKNLGPLPPGWEERLHSDGRIFYVDHNTRTTQWEDPRLSKLGGPAIKYSREKRKKYRLRLCVDTMLCVHG